MRAYFSKKKGLLHKKETTGFLGLHTLSVCDVSSFTAQQLQQKIEGIARERAEIIRLGGNGLERALREQWKKYKHYLKIFNDNFLVQQVTVKNVTTTVGRSALAARLSGTTTYTGIINYGALGTNATAAVVGNTQLGTEVYRKALSSGTFASNIAYLENFYTSSEVSGTFQEYGFFIDGTGTANSGRLFNHFNQTITKSVTESLNVQSIITLSDV